MHMRVLLFRVFFVIPLHIPNPPRVKDQGRTKDEPRNTQRTPNHPKVLFIKILTIEFAKESR